MRPSRPAPAAAGLPNTGGSSGVSSGLWLLLTGAVVFVVSISGVLAVSVPAFAPATRRTASGGPWSAQDVTGERRGGSQAATSAGVGWMFVVAAIATIMALIGYVLVSTDHDR